jgi:hypothetical protein
MQWSCARLTLPFEVETRRLKETNKLLDGVEKYYGIDMEYMFLECVEIQYQLEFIIYKSFITIIV